MSVKVLRDWDDVQATQLERWKTLNTPQPNGVACPVCGHECEEVANPAIGYVKAESKTAPPHWKVTCPACQWEGLRVAC